MKQRAEFTFEEQETVILKQRESYLKEFCPRCEEMVRLVRPDILAALTGASEREIFRLLEAGIIHFIEAKRIYACSDCYRKSFSEVDDQLMGVGTRFGARE